MPGKGGHQGIAKQPPQADKFKGTLTQSAIAELWVIEGGPPDKADLASAIATAESGGREKVFNGSCCHGLYQFNSNTLSVSCAENARCATRAAIKISKKGTDWNKWETFTNGAYKDNLGKSDIGTKNVGPDIPGAISGGIGDVTGGIGDVVGFIGRLFEPSFWLRVGKGILGLLLVLMGLQALSKVLLGMDVPNPFPAAKLIGSIG